MAKQKLTATTPLGTFTRTTDRPYLFVIASHDVSREQYVARHKRALAYAEKKLAEYEAVVAGQRPPMKYNTVADYTRYAATERKTIAAEQAALDDAASYDPAATVHLWGWSMSRRAAENTARKYRGWGYTDMAIYPVDGTQEVK